VQATGRMQLARCLIACHVSRITWQGIVPARSELPTRPTREGVNIRPRSSYRQAQHHDWPWPTSNTAGCLRPRQSSERRPGRRRWRQRTARMNTWYLPDAVMAFPTSGF
jgi:hypothetical protein